jgi:hypothetical protein
MQVNLKLGDSFKLMKLLEAEYAEKKLTDIQFAEYATHHLGFGVNSDHVFNRRTQLGIAATRTVATAENKINKKNSDKDVLFEMLCALEQRIVTLEKLVVNRIAVK